MQTKFFVVQGRGHFPDDMLRYDQCEVVSGDVDATVQRRIVLKTAHGNITNARWQSFGWTVICASVTTKSADESLRIAEVHMGTLWA